VIPYYASPDGMVQIYHARWEDGLAAGVFDPAKIALIHADPPYGIGDSLWGNRNGAVGQRRRGGRGKVRAFAPFIDDRPFSPGLFLELQRPTVLWGANHYASRLPDSPSWLFWDKREGQTSDNQSDGELAWTNLGGPLRTFSHYWRGSLRASEQAQAHLHPTQKPEALSAWIFARQMAREKLKAGDTILVPYLGSGPDLRPALAIGCRVIAFEVEEAYCSTAINARLRAVAEGSDPSAGLPLFAR